VGVLDASTSPPKERYAVTETNVFQLSQPVHAFRGLRPRRQRPRRRAAEQHDELASFCMTGKEHCEG
jgi:hypothetical protein